MNTKNARYSLNDIPTRVRFFRAWLVGAHNRCSAQRGTVLACEGARGRGAKGIVLAVLVALSCGAARAQAESCEQRCQQVREEGFSSISNPDGSADLCCCLVDDAGKSGSEPLEQCGKIP